MRGLALSARRMGRGNTPALEARLWQAGEPGQGVVDHRQPLDASLRGEPHRLRGHQEVADLRRPRDHPGLEVPRPPGRPAHCALLPGPVRPPAGATTADRGFLLLVDGQVMTAFGIFIQDFLQFRTRDLPEMFGITRSRRRYKRLGKLFMLLLTSGEMRKRLCDILKLWLHEPAGIQTTSITVHEEGKTDRGALKVISRENLDDGRFRIIYRADFRDDSFAEVVTEWLKKHGERRRIA